MLSCPHPPLLVCRLRSGNTSVSVGEWAAGMEIFCPARVSLRNVAVVLVAGGGVIMMRRVSTRLIRGAATTGARAATGACAAAAAAGLGVATGLAGAGLAAGAALVKRAS